MKKSFNELKKKNDVKLFCGYLFLFNLDLVWLIWILDRIFYRAHIIFDLHQIEEMCESQKSKHHYAFWLHFTSLSSKNAQTDANL